MAIAFRARGTVVSGLSTLTPGIPAGLSNNDTMYLAVQTSNQDPGAISGWIKLGFIGTGTGGAVGAVGLAIYKRFVATAAGESSPTVPDSGDHQLAYIDAYSGVDATSGEEQTIFTTA